MAVGGATGHTAQTATARRRRVPRTTAWIAERHGTDVLAPLVALYLLAWFAGAAEMTAVSGAPAGDFRMIVLGAMAFWSWYLMLRALDDLEDDPEDAVLYPDRLLQRRVVSREDLWLLVGLAAAFQGISSLAIDGGLGAVTLTWLAMLLFLAAVSVDFGAPRALAARPLLRRSLRIPASALPVIWAYAIGSGALGADRLPLTQTSAALIAVTLVTVAIFDISRKSTSNASNERSWGSLGEAAVGRLLAGLFALFGASCAALIVAADGAHSQFAIPILGGLTLLAVATALTSRAGSVAPLLIVPIFFTLLSLSIAAAAPS